MLALGSSAAGGVGMQIGLGHDVGRLRRGQHGVREELLDQIGVVGRQEPRQRLLDEIVDVLGQLLDFPLLLGHLGEQPIHRAVVLDQPALHDSEIWVPVPLGQLGVAGLLLPVPAARTSAVRRHQIGRAIGPRS